MSICHSTPIKMRPRRLRQRFMILAVQPWDMFFNVMARRSTRATLAALDDHMLKDIGISRSDIERIARQVAVSHHRSRMPQ